MVKMSAFGYNLKMNEIDYLRDFIIPDSPVLERLETESALRDDIQPPVERETGRFLNLLVRLSGARLVLELGTGNGYSGLWLAHGLSVTRGRLITIDSKERLHLEAVENYRSDALLNIITPLFGEVRDIINSDVITSQAGKFDMIFQDCGKSLYPELLDTTVNLLKPGGLLVADDTLFKSNPDIRENLGKFTDEYNRMVFDRKDLYSVILPAGHGLTISMKSE